MSNMKRVFAIAILLLSIPVSAGALTWHGHAAYVLRNHHARCATNYHRETIRVNGKRVVGCVYERPVTTVDNPVPLPTTTTTSTTTPAPPQTPVVSLSAHIDPTFTQSPSNPLAVTYAASASATVTTNGVPAPDPSLPSGVLDLFSDGSLECSTNVGGSVSSANCPVTYTAFGSHTVVTEYLSGSLTGSETDTETISQFASVVTVGQGTTGSQQVDSSNNYAMTVTVPVSLNAPDGTVTMSGGTCNPVSSGSTTCTEQIENSTSGPTTFTPSVTYSGDTNYSSSGGTGAGVTIPVAPAPTTTNVNTEVACAESGGFCSIYNSGTQTTGADANVFAGPTNNDQSPQIGTVTFTSSDHILICTATVYSAADLPSNNARCTGNGGPFSGPLSVVYSGGTIAQGDAYSTVYAGSSTSGGSN